MTDDAAHRKLLVYISLSYNIHLTLGVELRPYYPTKFTLVLKMQIPSSSKKITKATQSQNMICLVPPNDLYLTHWSSGLTKQLLEKIILNWKTNGSCISPPTPVNKSSPQILIREERTSFIFFLNYSPIHVSVQSHTTWGLMGSLYIHTG